MLRHFDLLDSFAKRQNDYDVRLILGIGLCAGAALCASVCSAAPATQSSADTTYSNFAFASELGSGVYQINGSTIQVYQLSPTHRLRYAERPGKQPGLKLIFPVTVGFFDFRTADLAHLDLPKNIGALSFEPGVGAGLLDQRGLARLSVRQGRRKLRLVLGRECLHLRFRNAQRRALQRVRRGGPVARGTDLCRRALHQLYPQPHAEFHFRLHASPPVSPNDAFTRLRNGVELAHWVGGPIRDRHFELGVYGISDVYLHAPQGPASGISARTLQFEFGVMFGMNPMYQLWGMELPRIGIGYLDAGTLSGWRLVIGNPF